MAKRIDTQLEKVTAGTSSSTPRYRCPACESTDISTQRVPISSGVTIIACTCNICGKKWNNKLDSSGGSGNKQ